MVLYYERRKLSILAELDNIDACYEYSWRTGSMLHQQLQRSEKLLGEAIKVQELLSKDDVAPYLESESDISCSDASDDND